jgi:hypothetical protein
VSEPAPGIAIVSKSNHRFSQRRAQRLKMIVAVVLSYVLTSTLMAAYALAGAASLSVPLYYLSCGLAISVFFYLLLYSGWTDKFKDHYLTSVQMYVTAMLMLAFIYIAPDYSLFLMNSLFIAISFGAMRLTRLQAFIALDVSAVGSLRWA